VISGSSQHGYLNESFTFVNDYGNITVSVVTDCYFLDFRNKMGVFFYGRFRKDSISGGFI
jgi:hypothetical protein